MSIRIMHVVDNVGWGGLQNGLLNLIRRLDPVRFEHVLCAVRDLEPGAVHPFSNEGVRLICLGKQEGGPRLQFRAMLQRIREVKPDILHSRNWSAIEAVLAGYWLRSCKLIHSEHGFDTQTGSREPLRRTTFRRMAFELADQVLCVSHQLRSFHARRTGFGQDRISVIHNGVDTQRFSPRAAERARVREELGLSSDTFCIGCVGNLTPVKDYATLLRAVEEFDRRCSQNWRLIIFGKGGEQSKLQSFVAAHPGWKQRVTFQGLTNRVPEMLNAMDVYVLSSLAEGISNSLLEAMATGLPVIASNTGGNPEVVIDGRSGALFPVGDSHRLAEQLSLLAGLPGRRADFAKDGLARVRRHFSVDCMVRQYEQLYEGIWTGAASAVRDAVSA